MPVRGQCAVSGAQRAQAAAMISIKSQVAGIVSMIAALLVPS